MNFLGKNNPFNFLNGRKMFKIEEMAENCVNLSGRGLFLKNPGGKFPYQFDQSAANTISLLRVPTKLH